ncbi:MAG: 30S ribosomal protein S17 [Chloroflexi bacterium]|nr:30S ribosomal protein S17 [Chloroflexota bacterium]
MKERRKARVGLVTSTKMQKTVVVSVETKKRHPLYNKISSSTVKYKAHDEAGACKLGDTVRIIETRPISKEKHWRVAEVVNRGVVPEVQPKEITE